MRLPVAQLFYTLGNVAMFRLLTTLFLLSFSPFTFSFDSVLINHSQVDVNVTTASDYFVSENGELSLLQVRDPSISRQFAPIHSHKISHSQLSNPVWLTFAINNTTSDPIRLFFNIDAPFLDSAELYLNIGNNGAFDRVTTGAEIAYRNRPYQVGNYVLPMTLQPGNQQVFLKLSPTAPTDAAVRLLDEKTFTIQTRYRLQFYTLVSAALIAIILFSLINYARFRSNQSLWAALVAIGFALNLSGWTGSVAWLICGIPWIEVAAINMGAFTCILGVGMYCLSMKTEPAPYDWLREAVIWLTRILIAIIILTCLPVTKDLLELQVVLVPVSFGVITLYWFKQRLNSQIDRINSLMLFATLLYFTLSTLVFLGLISAFTLIDNLFSALAIIVSCGLGITAWKSTSSTTAQVAVEGLALGDVHWPLMRKLNHEIRGPINGVLGMSELLQDTTLSAHQNEFVSTIQTAGFSLLREADQLQNLIRIGLNRLPRNEEEFDLYDLLENTLLPFSRVAHNKNIELILDVSPALPACYLGNAHLIEQILSNLLDNALKYTEQGEVLLQVKLTSANTVRFAVVDTGPGITKDFRANIFKFPVNRNGDAQQPKDVHLGLPISKHLTDLVKGEISIKSELRVGTTFQVDLPLIPAQADDTRPEPATGIGLNELRIMVLDDNLTCRKVIEHVALSWGADVMSMSNPQSAMANLHNQFHKAEPIDVLVLDQNMPSTTGVELSQRIREDTSLNSDIVIIMMTGVDDLTSDFTGSDDGVQYILSKPVSPRALKQTIQNAMPVIKINRGKNHGKKSYFF